MNLRLKLFLLIGSLFLIIAILSFYLPQRLLNQDIEGIRDTFDHLIAKHQEEDQMERKLTFLNRIQEKSYILNAILYSIHDLPSLRDSLNPAANPAPSTLWKEAARFISYNPGIDLIQITHEGQGTIALAIDNAAIYRAQAIPMRENSAVIRLQASLYSNQYSKETTYLGFKIQNLHPGKNFNLSDQLVLGSLANFIDPSYYFIYGIEQFFKLANQKIKFPALFPSQASKPKHIQKAFALFGKTPSIKAKFSSFPFWTPAKRHAMFNEAVAGLIAAAKSISVSPLAAYSNRQTEKKFRLREERSFLKRDMLEVLMQNLKQESPLAQDAPLGIAKLMPFSLSDLRETSGFALLSKEIFFNLPLFNDLSYYVNFGARGKSPIAAHLALINNEALRDIYIANTLAFLNTPELENENSAIPAVNFNLLTIGASLEPILEDLATNDEVIVFLTNHSSIRLAINSNGLAIPEKDFEGFPIEEMIAKPLKKVTVNGIAYDYFKIQPITDNNTFVLIIIPQSEEILYKFKNTMYHEMLSVSNTISFQLLAVSLLCLGISLIILGILSARITKPIAALAKATEDVSKGHYSDVHLPTDLHTHDEIAILSNSFSKMVHGLRDQEKIRGVLNKVVSKEIAEEILKGAIHLGGEEKYITIFFSDIRHFSKMTEHLSPHTVIEFLNTYMTKMSDIIEKNNGVIDKYVGDEIMALYGAPLESHAHALRAISTALVMIEKLKEWNKERTAEGLPPVEIGVGIHTGIVVAGNMGAETRLNYTVLGANVNLASRLCMTAAPMQILITEHTLNALYVKDAIVVEELPPMQFKGFSEPVRTFSVKGFSDNSRLEGLKRQ